MSALLPALLLAGAYLLGAVPFGLVLARRAAGVDVRTVGSGNIGATNAARAAGKWVGALVLLLDAAKALVPVLLAQWLRPTDTVLHAAVGCAAVVGHVFPIYLRFAGGKGVASGMGALLGLCPLAVVGGAVAFALCVVPTRVVSLGSLVGAGVTVVLAFALSYPLPDALAALAIASLIALRHRGNIERLWRRRERRL